MISQLLWKDAMTIRALLLAVLVGIFGATACLFVVSPMMSDMNVSNLFVSFWVLMPNLFAIGAPAILIGNEEEQGSLSWLKTLPVRWQSIADAKILVAVAGLIICWIISSLCLITGCVLLTENLTSYAVRMVSLGGVAHLANFSLMLLWLGFVTAYWFRSPVAGLVAVVPLIGGFTYLSDLLERLILTGQLRYNGPLPTPSQRDRVILVAAVLLGLLCAWCLQRMLAKRRLNRVSGRSSILPLDTMKSDLAYQLPVAVIPRRPSIVAALMWQQWRQCLYLGLPIFGMGMSAIVFALLEVSFGQAGPWLGLLPLLLGLTALWLGGLVFYGDNFRNCCGYFAERGLKANLIWCTRLSLPLLLCLLLIACLAIGSVWVSPDADMGFQLSISIVLIPLCFSFGQLVSQWVRRPVLTFFAAPALVVVPTIFLIMFCGILYSTYLWWMLLSTPVLLFATWKLAGAWVEGKGRYESYKDGKLGFLRLLKTPEFHAVSYAMLAFLLPMIVIMSLRIATMPAPRTQWREQLLAVPVPEPKTYGFGWAIYQTAYLESSEYMKPEAPFVGSLSPQTRAECLKLLRDEIIADEMGDAVSMSEIRWVFDHTSGHDAPQVHTELALAADEVLITWAVRIREGVCAGEFAFRDLMLAERFERMAVENLFAILPSFGPSPLAMPAPLAKLVAQIPNSDLRRESRRIALLANWQIYNRQKWVVETGSGSQLQAKTFLGYAMASLYSAIPFERWRADRNVDELTYVLLSRLEGQPVELDENGSPEHGLSLWRELIAPVDYRVYQLPTTPYWTRANDERLEQLKSKVAKLVLSDENNLSED